jgi:hypothetical protein
MTKAIIFSIIIFLFAACTSTFPSPTQKPLPTPIGMDSGTAATGPPQPPTIVLTETSPTLSPQTVSPPRGKEFVDQVLGISFSYPPDWENLLRSPDEPSGLTLHGPGLGQGPEPIIFSITIDVQTEPEKALGVIVEQQLAQVPNDLRGGIRRRSLKAGGELAEEVIGLPSISGAVETFVLHNGQIYLIILQPYDESNESLVPYLPQARSVYDGVLASWKFLK